MFRFQQMRSKIELDIILCFSNNQLTSLRDKSIELKVNNLKTNESTTD